MKITKKQIREWDRRQKINKLEAFRPKGVSQWKSFVLLPTSKMYFDPTTQYFWLMGPGGEPDWQDDPIEPRDWDYKRTLSRLSSKDKSIIKKSLRGKGNWKEARKITKTQLKKMIREELLKEAPYMGPDELGKELEYRLGILGAAIRKHSKYSAKWAEKMHRSAPATIKMVDTLTKILMKMK